MSDALRQGLRSTTERARGLSGVFQGFKDFISRGNAVELAVGVVIGAAFGAVVTAVQSGLIGPLIAMIFGKPDISELWVISGRNDAEINVGVILNALLQFLITAAAVYFVIVLPLNKLAERRKRGIEAEPARPSEDILLLQEIRDLLAARSSTALSQDTAGSPVPGTSGASGPATPGVTGRSTGTGDPVRPPLA